MIHALLGALATVLLYHIITKKKCDCSEEPNDNIWWYGNVDADNGLGETVLDVFINDKKYRGFNRDGEIIIKFRDKDSFVEFDKWMTLVGFDKLVKHYKKDLKFEVGEDKGTLFGCFPKFMTSDDKKYNVTLSYDGYKI